MDYDKKWVDLNLILEESKTALRRLIEETGTVIIAGYLPEARVIPFQIKQVFQNLISHAIKFRHPEKPPSICITASMGENNTIHLKFRDDGIGADKEATDSIFNLFGRLPGENDHNNNETGIYSGKKTVSHRNGSFYAESNPGTGNTFHLLIPH